MNWKLCVFVSILGLLMGMITISIVPSTMEPFFWLAVFLISAFLIAKYAPGKYFLHGFLVSILNSVWVTLAHMSRYDDYVAAHPEFLQMVQNLPPALGNDPRLLMVPIGLISGILSGLVLGLFCWIASKLIKATPIDH